MLNFDFLDKSLGMLSPAHFAIFLIKLFLYMTKKSRQKLKYLENEKSF